jgi:PAS domain S-box-containing protein
MNHNEKVKKMNWQIVIDLTLYLILLTPFVVAAIYARRCGIKQQQELEESQEKLRSTLESLDDLVFVLDKDGVFIDYHQPFTMQDTGERLFVPPEAFIGRQYKNVMPPYVASLIDNAIKDLISTHIAQQIDYSLIIQEDEAWFSAKLSMRRDNQGHFAGVTCVVRNVTARKRVEVALRDSEEKHRTLFETMKQGVAYQATDGTITSANPAAEQILGLTLDQIQGRTSVDPQWRAIHEDGSDFPGETHPSMVALKSGEAVYGVTMGVFNPLYDEYRWIVINAILLFRPGEDTPYQVYTTFDDITERKRAEEALQKRNFVLETMNKLSREITSSLELESILGTVASAIVQMVEATSAYICEWDGEQGIITVLTEYFGPESSALERVSDLGSTYNLRADFGKTVEWLETPTGYDNIHVDDAGIDPNEREHLEEHGAKSTLTIPLIVEGKSWGYIELWESRHRRDFTHEEIELVQAIAGEVSMAINNARLYEALRESEERLKATVASMDDLVFVLDKDNKFSSFDQPAHRSRLYALPETFLGKAIEDVLPSYVVELLDNAISAMGEAGAVQQFDYGLVIEGEERWYSAKVSRRAGSAGKFAGVTVVARDITEQKAAERRGLELKLERERMQILTNFINQASHEFSTPLSIINMNTYLLKKIDDPTVQQRHILEIDTQVTYITTLIDALTTMSRLDGIQELTTEEVDLCAVIETVNKTRQSILQSKNVRSVLELETKPLLLQVDIGYLQQAVQHIVDNAVAHTPEGGTIAIRADSNNDNIIIEITDTGVGINEDDLPHIFERFYRGDKFGTTRGFGLGLPIAKAIIELHQGSIKVESEPGKGSTFRIILPKKLSAGDGTGSHNSDLSLRRLQ